MARFRILKLLGGWSGLRMIFLEVLRYVLRFVWLAAEPGTEQLCMLAVMHVDFGWLHI